MHDVMDLLTIISLIVGIISVILGVVAIIQSYKQNKDSQRINKDTKKMLEMSIINQELLQQHRKSSHGSKMLNLDKDQIILKKLSYYNKSNSDKIIKELENLSIKNKTLNYLKDFLNSNKEECEVNFISEASMNDESNLVSLVRNLLKYDVLIFFIRLN